MNGLAKATLILAAEVAILLAMSCRPRLSILSGVVTGRSGEPIESASVAIFPVDASPNMEPFTPSTILRTDRNGRFRFPPLAPIMSPIIGDFFIHSVANKTLHCMKAYVEARADKVTA